MTALTEKTQEIAADAPLVETPAGNVVEALRRVMRDLPAIGKDQTASAQQGGYAYRGIEQITKHAQPLFAKHGVVLVPHVLSWEVRDLTVNGKPWTDTYAMVEYTAHGPGGRDDSVTVGPILAIGRDNSDKGANKCMTQALKYALLQVLCISDAKDDGDGQTHEAEHKQPEFTWTHKAVKADLLNLCGGDKDKAAEVWEWASGDDQEPAAGLAAKILERWEARPFEVEPPEDSEDVSR